jgi:hypothetical protein
MSRTTLCALTAGGLVTLSLLLMAGRYQVLGEEMLTPQGPRTWKVTMKVTGTSTAPAAKLMTITPLDFDHQHIRLERFQSAAMQEKPPTARHPERRQVIWTQRAGVAPGPFAVLYDFYCDVDVRSPSRPMSQLARSAYAPPAKGERLESEPLIETDHPEISALARRLIEDREGAYDQMEALYHHVAADVDNDPNVGAMALGAVDCLQAGRGDSRAKSRLLVALCRNRGIPARLVTGLTLTKGHEQSPHVWAEAWVHDHWRPLCPFYRHLGRVPPTFLVFGFGDLAVVRGHHVQDLDFAFLVERTAPETAAAAAGAPPSNLRRFVRKVSVDALPGPERRLVEFLLLLPLAGLIVCIYRNIIGLYSFGTFAPALIGLAFRDLHSLPGIVVFTAIMLLGWGMRRFLDRYHLLQVPRTAVMLNLVVVVLIVFVIASNFKHLEATKYIPLFPIVILTGMIERFWTLEVEDGASASFRTLLGTLLISATIALLLSWDSLVHHMLRFPETLGIIMALQLLIGRYTGYRLSELFRFRDFLQLSEG